MKVFNSKFWSCLAMACCSAAPLFAQSLTDTTLDFENITSTNINQTVAENAGLNEKEIDFGDIDGDGDIDAVIAVAQSDFGQRRNKLYRNDNGVLNEVSGSPVIPGFSLTDTSRSAFLRDYDNDGDLDIIIINDSNSGTANNDSPGTTKLFLQNAAGNFVNTSQNLGGQTGAACNGISKDLDGNGTIDLVMCNYPNISQDSMTLNGINGNPAGMFTVVTNTNYPQEQFYGVHAEAADMNGDGQCDICMANWTGSTSFIYYNNNEGAGSGPGDFRYGGAGASSSFPAIGGADERGMFPCDFNGDGMMDIYFANAGNPGRTDSILINTGNDANNRATFSSQPFFAVHNNETNKVSCRDLDGDGMPDIVVMRDNTRPFIYRNISTATDVAFVEWTPANMTVALDGWQANSADITGNGRADIMFGGNTNDHLFENTTAAVTDFDSLTGGLLPSFHDASPIAISGTIAEGETKVFIAAGIPFDSTFSVVARSAADLGLSVQVSGVEVGASDRTGEGVVEGVQYQTAAANSNVIIEVTNNGGGGILLGDLNGDGQVSLLDVQPFIDLLSNNGFDPAGDFNGDGAVNLLDVALFVDSINGGSGTGGDAEFIVEFLSRS